MAPSQKIKDLLSVNTLNRKRSDQLLNQILVDICFEMMSEVSNYFYTSGAKQAKYTSFCGNIFTKVTDSIKEAHRSNTFEEYEVAINEPILFVEEIVDRVASKHEFIITKEGHQNSGLLKELNKEHKKIYKKFFIRKRKARKNGKSKKR